MQSFAPLFSNTWGILVLILFFGGSIFIHELGHYLAAKWRKLKIERFSIGFGPRLFGWKNKDGVDFRISLLPLGGYVALPQLADMGRLEGDQNEDGDEGEETLPHISYADKVIVSAAGAVFNVIFALAVGSLIWVIGQPSSEGQQTTIIGYVSPTLLLDRNTEVGGPGHKAGLLPGDQVQAIDGRKIRDFYDMQHSIVTGAGRTRDGKPQTIFTILRNGQPQDLTIHPELITINPASGDKVRQIGILPATHIVSQLVENSPAHKAGLQLNDRIVSVNGQPVFSIPAIREHLKKSGEQPITLGIDRNGQAMDLQIQPQLKAERKTTLTLRIPDDVNPIALHFLPKYAKTPTEIPSPKSLAELILFEIEGNPAPSGFQPRIGDVLIKIGKKSISSIHDVETAVQETANAPKVLSLQSGDIQRNLNLPETTQIKIEPVVIQPLLGFVMGGETRIHLNPLTQIRRHFNTTLQVLGSLLNRNSDIGVQQLSGPIGIGRVFHRYANIDFRLVLVFAVLLNINLAILNMLPIPVLDGGHILFATVAKFRKKGLPINFIVRIQTVFVLLLFSMIIYVGVYDSLRWKGDNQEEHRYEILRSLYFDPAILTTTETELPNSQKPNPDGEAIK
jgi:RIP metalloprotease RseP